MKKLYLVKREVRAGSIKEALTAKGVVYEVVEAANQVEELKPNKATFGLNKKK